MLGKKLTSRGSRGAPRGRDRRGWAPSWSLGLHRASKHTALDIGKEKNRGANGFPITMRNVLDRRRSVNCTGILLKRRIKARGSFLTHKACSVGEGESAREPKQVVGRGT